MRTASLATSPPAAAPAHAPRPPPRRPFAETLGRAARLPPPRSPRVEPGEARADGPVVAGLVGPMPPASALTGGGAGAAPAASAASSVTLEHARLAVDGIALRDRGALELRFGTEAVRLDATPAGVELRVDAGPRAVQGALNPAALADAVRARGVPVVRAEVRAGGERREGGRRPRR